MTNAEIVRGHYKKELTLFDDLAFRILAQRKELVQKLLRVFLNDDKLVLLKSEIQKNISFFENKSIILDCYCKLSNGKFVSIEVERNDNGNKCDHQRRVRYYGSAIDIMNMKKGQKYDVLPDVYMIYLTSKDFLKLGKSAYHVDRVVGECGKVVDNGYHEIYINAEVDDKSDIAEVLKTLIDKNYKNDKFKEVRDLIKEEDMPIEVERAIEGLKEEGRQEGRQEGQTEVVKKLIKQGLISEKDAASILNVSLEKLQKMIKELA